MKQCSYCGHENADDAAHCLECGVAFEGPPEPAVLELPGTASSTFGTLSVATPFVCGVLIWFLFQTEFIVIFAYIPPLFVMLFLTPPLVGLAFARLSRKRREANRLMWLIGFSLNVTILLGLLLALAYFLAFGPAASTSRS